MSRAESICSRLFFKQENFHKVIKIAMISCENSGRSILDQFPEVRDLVEGGVAPWSKIDYELTRYACYVIVQNGDPRKGWQGLKQRQKRGK